MVDYGRVADVVREEILAAGHKPNACIMAARYTTMVLQQFGIAAEAMAAKVEVFSPAYVELMRRAAHEHRVPTQAEVDEYAERGAWRVILSDCPAPEGVEDNRGAGYNGHVVILAERRRWLLDPTLPQVNRPHKGMIVDPPYAQEIDYRRASRDGIVLAARNGTVTFYELQPKRRDFVLAQDWRAEDWRRSVQRADVARIVARIQAAECYA